MSDLSQRVAQKWLASGPEVARKWLEARVQKQTPTQMQLDDLRLPVSDVRFERAMQMAAKYMGGTYRNGTIRFPYRFRDRSFPQELTVLYRKMPCGFLHGKPDGKPCVSFDVFPNVGGDPRRSKIYRSFPATLKDSKTQFGKFNGWLRIVGDAIRRYVAQAEAGQSPQFARIAMKKTGYEIYVDGRGNARDDEGNTWQVDRQRWPEGTYFGNDARLLSMSGPKDDYGSSRSRRPSRPAPKRLTLQEAKEGMLRSIFLGLALLSKKDMKASKFVQDVLIKRWAKGNALTDKQSSYFEGLEKRHKSLIDQMRRIFPSVTTSYVVNTDTGTWQAVLNPAEKKQALRFFDLDPPKKGKGILLLPKGEGTPVVEKTEDKKWREDQLAALDTLLGRQPNNSFLKSIREQVEKGRTLSEKQRKAIRQTLYKNRMRPDADLFRGAAQRVAAAWLAKKSQKTEDA